MQFAILFSPITRVYNLRFLLVLTVAALVYWIIQLVSSGPDALFEFEYGTFLAVILGIVSSAVIILHQVIWYVYFISPNRKKNGLTRFHPFVVCLRGAYVVWLQSIWPCSQSRLEVRDRYGEYLPE